MFKVILIEDDPMVQEVNRMFVDRVEGFQVLGAASNGSEGIQLIERIKPDLVLVDVFMPNQDGLETMKQIRAKGYEVDVIAITAASDMDTIRTFLQQGAFDYIMKPFKFERIKKALENYRSFRVQVRKKQNMSQEELDEILFQKELDEQPDLPKGLNAVTLKKVISFLTDNSLPTSAEEVAEGVGIARVTARRYLEYLEKCGKVIIDIQYGGIGRPVNRYVFQK
ncbi:response regulator [Bacillus sp. DNRA2]|uniref:response regulator n=1 Tax=Bacillus sp. DNRA2 TaxID=2723053 RepID=UPI00145D01FF|nr:response regulator [Bacillus sp. DNRA2]NMD69739.1 response regulator [Bacillus sp. DNRA2]